MTTLKKSGHLVINTKTSTKTQFPSLYVVKKKFDSDCNYV